MVTREDSGSQPNSFQFAGQQTDPTGLQYLRAGYYDPSTGSFLSRDPLSTMPQWSGSPFGYAVANPSSNVDPTGNICLGPVCIDRNGVSVGGHEAVAGVRTVSDWVLTAALSKVSKQLRLIGEYAARIAAGCVVRFVDCYFALDHIGAGVAIILAGMVAYTACLATNVGVVVCLAMAAAPFLAALAAGSTIIGLGIQELLNLKDPEVMPGRNDRQSTPANGAGS